jgi:hypothetical protein
MPNEKLVLLDFENGSRLACHVLARYVRSLNGARAYQFFPMSDVDQLQIAELLDHLCGSTRSPGSNGERAVSK